MQTLGHFFRRNAQLYPNLPALIFEDRTVTFSELLRRVNRLGSSLWNIGLRKRDRVSVLAMNCAEFVEIWGVGQVAGFNIAPVNFRLSAPEIAWIVNDIDPKMLIFEAQYTDLLASILAELPENLRFICIGTNPPDWAVSYETFLAGGSEEGAPCIAEPEDPLSLIYTSGTTGRPKGALRSNRADLSTAMTDAIELDIVPGDKYLLMMPLFHIGASAQHQAAFWRGATVVLHRGFNAGRVLEAIETYRVTHVHMAPTLIHDCFEHPDIDRRDLSSIKTIFYAAAPMPVGLLRNGLARLGNVFCNGYGSTEATGLCLHKIDHVLNGPAYLVARLSSVGQPQIDSDARIIDDDWNELPIGEIGEIALKSLGNMERYWNNDAATARALRDGWFRTGDVGYMDSEKFFFLMDRKKDMIVSGGENIYSREVENALSNHPAISEVAVIGVPDLRWGETVRALVVVRKDFTISEAEIIEYCKAAIARYKAPKSVRFVEELIRLPNGKINKIRLRELHGSAA